MMDTVKSKVGVNIRLTSERWTHIVEGHNELAGMREDVLETVAFSERILAGNAGELLAVCEKEPGRLIVAVYRELQEGGFIITAFVTRRVQSLDRRRKLWP